MSDTTSGHVVGFDDFFGPMGLYQMSEDAYENYLIEAGNQTGLIELYVDAINRFAQCTGTADQNFDHRFKMIKRLADVDQWGWDFGAPDRAHALRRWCRGLVALHSALIDKAIIGDPAKLWPYIAVLGEVQTALA